MARFKPQRGTLLTVGVFDGVHRGHQRLIGRLIERASEHGLQSGVVTFRCHPEAVLRPEAKLARLTTVEERARLLKDIGVDFVILLDFTPDVAALSAREFVLALKSDLLMQGLVVGPDFALGRKREGNTAALRKLGEELAFSVEVVEPLYLDDSKVSSTAIRNLLTEGDMKSASRLLGRYFSLTGKIVGGSERGHLLGYPTANIAVDAEQALPADGVYATLGHLRGQVYPSATNIGVRPTFDNGERLVEVFLIDFEGDIYGETLTVELVERLRGEIKFANVEQLIEQIRNDVERTREILRHTLVGRYAKE